jgi:hypothetical protein
VGAPLQPMSAADAKVIIIRVFMFKSPRMAIP